MDTTTQTAKPQEARIPGESCDCPCRGRITCAGCEGLFPEKALNYRSGDPLCVNCQDRHDDSNRRQR